MSSSRKSFMKEASGKDKCKSVKTRKIEISTTIFPQSTKKRKISNEGEDDVSITSCQVRRSNRTRNNKSARELLGLIPTDQIKREKNDEDIAATIGENKSNTKRQVASWKSEEVKLFSQKGKKCGNLKQNNEDNMGKGGKFSIPTRKKIAISKPVVLSVTSFDNEENISINYSSSQNDDEEPATEKTFFVKQQNDNENVYNTANHDLDFNKQDRLVDDRNLNLPDNENLSEHDQVVENERMEMVTLEEAQTNESIDGTHSTEEKKQVDELDEETFEGLVDPQTGHVIMEGTVQEREECDKHENLLQSSAGMQQPTFSLQSLPDSACNDGFVLYSSDCDTQLVLTETKDASENHAAQILQSLHQNEVRLIEATTLSMSQELHGVPAKEQPVIINALPQIDNSETTQDKQEVQIDYVGSHSLINQQKGDRRMRKRTYANTPMTSEELASIPLSKSGRCAPQKHVVVAPQLQDLIDNLQETDSIDNHLVPVGLNGGIRNKYACKYCGEDILNRHHFRRHINKQHKDIHYKPWKCPLCDYKTLMKAGIARHINVHSDIKPYTCLECGKGFTFRQKLQIHMKYHKDQRDFQCILCEMAFHELKTLKTHLSKIHGIDKPKEFIDKYKGKSLTSVFVQLDDSSTLAQGFILPNEQEKKTSSEMVKLRKQLLRAQALEKKKQLESEVAEETKIVDGILYSNDNQQEDGPLDDRFINETIRPTVQSNKQSGDRNKLEETEIKVKQTESFPTEKKNEEVDEVNVLLPRHKKSSTYGTRKTMLRTSRYKLGLESNYTPIKSGTESTDDELTDNQEEHSNQENIVEETAESTGGINPKTGRQVKVINNQKIVSEDQLDDQLKQYCRVDTGSSISRIIFHCTLCSEKFYSKTQFCAHLEHSHPDVKPWKCVKCGFTCRMRTSLLAHCKTHDLVKKYQCSICNKRFLFKQKLNVHMRSHANLRAYLCPMCDKRFNEKVDVTRHMSRVHNKEEFACEHCERTFRDDEALSRHMETHNPDKRYLCPYCNNLYRSKGSLAQHVKSHTCMFHCEICSKNFGSYSGFMAHKVMHDQSFEGFECDICSKRLHTKGSFTRHRTVAHSNYRPFQCSLCNKGFKTKKDLKNHGAVHSTVRAFTCSICQFSCKRAESLKIHMRRHSDIKPYQCGLCGKEYIQRHSLETHLKHHTGQSDAVCSICNREFPSRYLLRKHILLAHHPDKQSEEIVNSLADNKGEGVTVFICEECNSMFLSQDDLAIHILAEHMKTDDNKSVQSSELNKADLLSNLQSSDQTKLCGDLNDVSTVGIAGLANEQVHYVTITDPHEEQPGSSKVVSLLAPEGLAQQSYIVNKAEDPDEMTIQREEVAQFICQQNTVKSEEEILLQGNLMENGQQESQNVTTMVSIMDPNTHEQVMVPMATSALDALLVASGIEQQEDSQVAINEFVAETVEVQD